jgi:hypothetical protein
MERRNIQAIEAAHAVVLIAVVLPHVDRHILRLRQLLHECIKSLARARS